MVEWNEFWASRGTPKISECNSEKCLFHSLPNREFPEYLVEWKESNKCSSAVCYLQTTGPKRAVRYQLPYLWQSLVICVQPVLYPDKTKNNFQKKYFLFLRHITVQSNRSFNIPPPRAYPGHLTSFPAREGRNLINLVFPGAGI